MSWEAQLLTLAHEARESQPTDGHHTHKDAELLQAAYDYAETLTRIHSRTFYLASGLLPQGKRQAARALYAFCRVTDDLVDNSTGNASAALSAWRARSLASHPTQDDLLALAWADTRQTYQIPLRYAEQLISGVALDMHKTRYASFDELAVYCYGVACTVGLMAMHIIGYRGSEAVPYAIRLGVALQMTNILRDVGEDWRAGRVYLPQDELAAFNIREKDLAAGRSDRRWREFMRFQIERNRQLYAEALPGIRLLERDGRFAIGAAAELYQAILADIEAHDYDVFNRRSYVSTWGKLRRLPGIWGRSVLGRYAPRESQPQNQKA